MADRKPKPRRVSKRGRHGEGRPQFVPTEQDRQIVESHTIIGTEQAEIVRCLSQKITVSTLRKHFKAELATGLALFKSQLMRSMRATAIGRPARPAQVVGGVRYSAQPAIPPNPIMQIWCSKNLLGWRDKMDVGNDGDRPFAVAFRWADATPAPEPDDATEADIPP